MDAQITICSLTSRDLVTESHERVFGRCVAPPTIQSCRRVIGHHEAKSRKACSGIVWFMVQLAVYNTIAVVCNAGGRPGRNDW